MKRVLIIILALSICLLSTNFAFAESKNEGLVRVLLTNLKLENEIKIGIWGEYAIEDRMYFQRGAEFTVKIENNQLVLYYEGMVMPVAASLFVKRYSSLNGKENGLRLQGMLNLYEGDIDLTVYEGKLRAILYSPIEEYLKGVVPYEMNDSFPLEALKAQAIAARTYTIKNLKPKNDYDLVDNTNDQVYKGSLEKNVNAHKAIADTEGYILSYKSKAADTFYTASNGGKTESVKNVWGGENIDYLIIKDDPYDLKNTESTVKSLAIDKNFAEMEKNNIKLYEFIISKANESLIKNNYDPNSAVFESIKSLELRNPLNNTKSAVYKTLNMNITIKVKKMTETSVKTINLKLDFDLFEEIEQNFDLSINLKNNETTDIIENKNEFILSFRRFGHGVGMSQRGAEQMAIEGKKYTDILEFYYPGTKLAKSKTTRVLLNAGRPEFITSPAPTPTATPRPTLMPLLTTPSAKQSIAKVGNISEGSTLNLRSSPSTNSQVVMQMYFGQRLLVINEVDENWVEVKTDVVSGFVMKKFLIFE